MFSLLCIYLIINLIYVSKELKFIKMPLMTREKIYNEEKKSIRQFPSVELNFNEMSVHYLEFTFAPIFLLKKCYVLQSKRLKIIELVVIIFSGFIISCKPHRIY